MSTTVTFNAPPMNTQALFYQQYEAVRRDEIVGILLALFLGGFGAHHFYLRRTGLGILYACFFWTPVVWIIAFVECFFMPGRVREFNAIQAAAIAGALGVSMPTWGQPVNVTVNVPGSAQETTLAGCSRCQRINPAGSHYCAGCGAVLNA
jgi:TM2 domain-containing membrane protein YozV